MEWRGRRTAVSMIFQLGLTAGLELADEERAELCLRFVHLGWTQLLHEVVGAKVMRVTPGGAEWLPERLGAKYVRAAQKAGVAGWSNAFELPAYFEATDLYVPSRRVFFEQILELPGTPLDGLKVSTGGDSACWPLWRRKREIEATPPGEEAPDRRAVENLLTLLAVGRSRHMVVRLS